MLERSCFGRFGELGELKSAIESLGVQRVCLSGSGSALFSIMNEGDVEHVARLQDRVARKTGCRSVIVRNNLW
jgi:homoserine kinase